MQSATLSRRGFLRCCGGRPKPLPRLGLALPPTSVGIARLELVDESQSRKDDAHYFHYSEMFLFLRWSGIAESVNEIPEQRPRTLLMIAEIPERWRRSKVQSWFRGLI